nr:hypothetical protein [Tanacetum cinerariifolium]
MRHHHHRSNITLSPSSSPRTPQHHQHRPHSRSTFPTTDPSSPDHHHPLSPTARVRLVLTETPQRLCLGERKNHG